MADQTVTLTTMACAAGSTVPAGYARAKVAGSATDAAYAYQFTGGTDGAGGFAFTHGTGTKTIDITVPTGYEITNVTITVNQAGVPQDLTNVTTTPSQTWTLQDTDVDVESGYFKVTVREGTAGSQFDCDPSWQNQ